MIMRREVRRTERLTNRGHKEERAVKRHIAYAIVVCTSIVASVFLWVPEVGAEGDGRLDPVQRLAQP